MGHKRTIVILALALAGCSSPLRPVSTPTSDAVLIRLNATSATLPLINDLTRSYAQVTSGVSFEISSTNYNGAVRRAGSSDPVYFLTNHLPPEDDHIWGAPLGQDGIAIITHLGNPVGSLSIDQLRAIYQGQINNWAALGGPAMTITVIRPPVVYRKTSAALTPPAIPISLKNSASVIPMSPRGVADRWQPRTGWQTKRYPRAAASASGRVLSRMSRSDGVPQLIRMQRSCGSTNGMRTKTPRAMSSERTRRA